MLNLLSIGNGEDRLSTENEHQVFSLIILEENNVGYQLYSTFISGDRCWIFEGKGNKANLENVKLELISNITHRETKFCFR